MILYNPDVNNTEAGIVPNYCGKMYCKITKLSGMYGETDIWFYWANGHLRREPGPEQLKHRLGLQMYVDDEGKNILLFNSWYPFSEQIAGDSVIVYFHGGNAWRGVFLVDGIRENKRKRSLIIVPNYELSLFAEHYVNYVELINHRTGRVTPYTFLDFPNQQYKNAQDGEELLRIMTRRLLGAKQVMVRNMLPG